jgi:hypothetical protein
MNNHQDPSEQLPSAVALPNVEEDQNNRGADTDENMSPSGRKFK